VLVSGMSGSERAEPDRRRVVVYLVDAFWATRTHLRVPHQPAYKRASPHVVNPVHLRRFSLILSLSNKLSDIFRLSP